MRSQLSNVLIWIMIVLGVSLGPSALQAQSELEARYLAVKLTLGVGGSRSMHIQAVMVGNAEISTSGVRSPADLAVSYGIGAQYMVPLHRNFALGGLLNVESWRAREPDERGDRNVALDLAVVPQGRYAVAKQTELYAALPIGLALENGTAVGSYYTRGVKAPGGDVIVGIVDAPVAWGVCVALKGGVRWLVRPGLGLLGELGLTYRVFAHTTTFEPSGMTAGASLSMYELTLSLGAHT